MITIIENKFEKSEMEHLINIYEKYINHREIDKYGTEVINWFDLPDEIDDNTLQVKMI